MEQIILQQPINPEELLWFLSRGYDEIVYRVCGKSVYRAFGINGKKILVRITLHELSVSLEWLSGAPDEPDLQYIKNFVTNWFDLETDISAFYGLLKVDPVLAYMAEEYNGLKLVGMPDVFEALCWAIIGQQINLAFAYKLKRRFVEKYGDFIDHEHTRYYLFPSPQAIAGASIDDLKTMQLSGSKAAYLVHAASAFVAGHISRGILAAMADARKRIELLTSLKGVGAWTANYVLMKSLNNRTAIPYGDAGLLNALVRHGFIADKKELHGMHQLFEKFAGWEAYLVFYLWRSLAIKPGE